MTDPGFIAHERLCKLLQTALTVDQWDGTNSAAVELICREIQMIEETHADRMRSRDTFHEERELFLKTTTGHGNDCASPL